MFEKLMAFLNSLGEEEARPDPEDPSVAVIALALNVINADGVVHDNEAKVLESVIRAHSNLSKSEFDVMLETARREEENAVDLYRFTSRINRALDENQKVELISMLWQIVHADEDRNELEDHLVWRIAELIGVSGRDRVGKRRAAEQKLKDDQEGK
jgi:uncharacterized tellurite resistance protein B-like protein